MADSVRGPDHSQRQALMERLQSEQKGCCSARACDCGSVCSCCGTDWSHCDIAFSLITTAHVAGTVATGALSYLTASFDFVLFGGLLTLSGLGWGLAGCYRKNYHSLLGMNDIFQEIVDENKKLANMTTELHQSNKDQTEQNLELKAKILQLDDQLLSFTSGIEFFKQQVDVFSTLKQEFARFLSDLDVENKEKGRQVEAAITRIEQTQKKALEGFYSFVHTLKAEMEEMQTNSSELHKTNDALAASFRSLEQVEEELAAVAKQLTEVEGRFKVVSREIADHTRGVRSAAKDVVHATDSFSTTTKQLLEGQKVSKAWFSETAARIEIALDVRKMH
ncbi:hypothetical protein JYU14_03875 [Simkania negevensis]|uniref:Uncharacterized protein n=1 Tax=Simkania negevensis TaxID=83561 RepID=A0ABS3ARN8_9BACT|nr:hypothetical protein [Simkania negevensis]